MALRMSYCTLSATRPPRYLRTYRKANEAKAKPIRSTSQGHSDELWETTTPSTICRSMRGMTVWQTLPSTAAVTAKVTSLRWTIM